MIRGERLALTCAHCGEEFTRLKSQQKSATAYCSDACRAAEVGLRRAVDLRQRFQEKVEQTTGSGCWRFTGALNNKGYGVLGLGGHRAPKVLAHRYAYELANGPIPEGLVVMHICDNPACVNPAHLALGTQAENLADMRRKKRQGGQFAPGSTSGERNNKAKLTAEQVAQIRARYAAGGVPQHALAAEYGVDQTLIGLIVRNKIWKHTTQG